MGGAEQIKGATERWWHWVPLGPDGQAIRRRRGTGSAVREPKVQILYCLCLATRAQASPEVTSAVPSSVNRGPGRTHLLGLLSEDLQAKYQPRTIGTQVHTRAQ